MMSALHQDGTPWAGAEDYDGVAIERGIADKHSQITGLLFFDFSFSLRRLFNFLASFRLFLQARARVKGNTKTKEVKEHYPRSV